MDDPVN
jgi:hypothetical protein